MAKRELELIESSSYPFTVMWADDAYRIFAGQVFRLLIQQLEIDPRQLTINKANVFSLENEHPEYVSYPRVQLAKSIAEDGQNFLNGFNLFSMKERVRNYNFRVYPKEVGYVLLKEGGQKIDTATVYYDVGWSQKTE